MLAPALSTRVRTQDGFWTMAALMETHLPGYYAADLHGVQNDVRIFSRLLQSHAPSLWKKMQALGVVPELWCIQW